MKTMILLQDQKIHIHIHMQVHIHTRMQVRAEYQVYMEDPANTDYLVNTGIME